MDIRQIMELKALKAIPLDTKDNAYSIRIVLASLWVSLTFLYIYADVLSLYRPGSIGSILSGKMGPLEANQSTLFFAGLLMLVPCLMFTASFLFAYRTTRSLHVFFGVAFSLVNVANAAGETWAYYILYCVIELSLTIGIVVLAWRWKR